MTMIHSATEIPEVQRGQMDDVTHPEIMPNFPRKACSWRCYERLKSLFRLYIILGRFTEGGRRIKIITKSTNSQAEDDSAGSLPTSI